MWFPIQIVAMFCWSLVNLLDSVLVEHFHKRPYALQWHQSYWSALLLIILYVSFASWTAWSMALLAVGMISCFGDWIFFAAIDRMDVSLTQVAWAMMAVMLSIGGFVLFGERWSMLQSAGVLLLFAGVLLLTVWGKVLRPSHLVILFFLAAFNVPFYLVQKAALADGVATFQTFFWAVLGREGISLIIPLLIPSWRRTVLSLFPTMRWHYFAINALVIALFFTGVGLNTLAFSIGPLSLSVVVTNIQPFIILLLAYLLYRFLPRKAARELLTAQSLRVKIISFSVVFAGLALIALPQ